MKKLVRKQLNIKQITVEHQTKPELLRCSAHLAASFPAGEASNASSVLGGPPAMRQMKVCRWRRHELLPDRGTTGIRRCGEQRHARSGSMYSFVSRPSTTQAEGPGQTV